MPAKLLAYFASLLFALSIGFVVLYLSPNDPSRPGHQQGVQAGVAPVPTDPWAKLSFTLRKIAEGGAASYSSIPGTTTLTPIVNGLPVTLGINVPGTILAWLAAVVLGSAIGKCMGRPLGSVLMAALVALLIVPPPVWIELARALLQAVPQRSAAALTLAGTVLPVLTMNQAIVVAQAIESREAQMARAVGLPALLTWRSILLPRSLPFWRTQASLLLVGLFEGPILIERAFGFSDGLGSIAFGAALSSDKPLLLLLVGLTCTLVNLGVLACVTFGVEGHAGRVARRRVYAAR